MIKRLDHIGVLVDDLEDGKQFLEHVIHLVLDREITSKERGTRVAFYNCGGTQIELIELIDPDLSHQRRGGQLARIDHIALEVDELGQTISELRLLGVRTTETEPFVHGSMASFWTQPETSGGVTFQILEKQ
jgi:methylmalonyl-CoA/ethylmalonyl-CoA epimerase